MPLKNLSSLLIYKVNFLLLLTLYSLFLYIRVVQGGWEIQTSYFENFRQDLNNTTARLLPSPQAQLLSGILLGQKSELPGDFKVALRDTSTLHIVVVSGQNLTMLAGMFLLLSPIITRRAAVILSFCAIFLYTLLTGAEIPVLRAAVMASISFLAIFLGRQKDGFWVLIVSGGLMLLVNPIWIKELSFQLSFLATFGVVVVAPILQGLLKKLPNFISQDLSVTIAAQILVTPIIAQSFHQFSIVSVITNLLIGWTVPIIMILGAISLFFTYIFEPIAQLVALFTNAFLIYFVYIVKFFGSLPFAWEYVGEKSWMFWFGYYFVIAGVLLLLKNKFKIQS